MKRNFCVFLLGAIFSFFTDANSSTAIPFTVGISLTLAALVGLILLPPQWKPFVLLLLLINSPDQTQTSADIARVGELASATIWQFSMGPIRPSYIIVLLLCYLVSTIKIGSLSKNILLFSFWFLATPTATSIIYNFALTSPLSTVVSDLRFPLSLVLAYTYSVSLLKEHPELWETLQRIAFLLILGRFSVDALYFTAGQFDLYLSSTRVSVDSTKMLIIVLLSFFLFNLLVNKLLLPSILGCFLFAQILFAYQTRMLLVTGALGLAILISLFPMRRTAIVFIILAATFTGAYILDSSVYEKTVVTSTNRFISVKAEDNISGLAAVDPVRFACIYNASNTLSENYAWIWGMGYGAWFPESPLSFPAFADLDSAFPEEWVATGRFYRLHDMASHLIFKHGILGLILYSLILFAACRNLYSASRQGSAPYPTTSVAVLLGIAPTIYFYAFWSAKGAILLGLFLALTERIPTHHTVAKSTVPLPQGS